MATLEKLFEDKHICVLVKPVGMLSQSDESGDESVVSVLGGENPYVGVVHRLDRGVGGVMVYAKDKQSAGKLCAIVGDKELFSKSYLVVCHGKPEAQNGEMHDLIFKDSRLNKSYTVDRMR